MSLFFGRNDQAASGSGNRGGTFVGPDYGIFTYVLRAEQLAVQAPEQEGIPAWVGGMWGVAPNWASARREDGPAEEVEQADLFDEDLALEARVVRVRTLSDVAHETAVEFVGGDAGAQRALLDYIAERAGDDPDLGPAIA